MNYAVDIFNSPYGPLLQHLIFGKSPSLEAQIKSLPKTKFPLYEGSYPTYPGSGGVHDGKGSYPNIDIFEDGPSPYPEDRTWGVPKISNNRTMDFKDRNGNGIDDRDELGLTGLLQIDPAVQDALKRMEADRRAGIKQGPFQVQY